MFLFFHVSHGLLSNWDVLAPHRFNHCRRSEGLHGVRCGHGITCASGVTTTIFPQPIATAAAFNETLWYAVGSAISDEFRAFANSGRGNLSVFAPNINIFRDQRWGRGMQDSWRA